MGKKLLIDATHAEETRVVVVDGNKVEEFDFETIHKRQLAGNIYLAKITRVEPSLQAAFVDYGGNRHGFLAFAEIHPDYYQIPVADRRALLEEERALARAQDDDHGPDSNGDNTNGGSENNGGSNGRRSRRRRSSSSSDDGAQTASPMVKAQSVQADVVEAAEAEVTISDSTGPDSSVIEAPQVEVPVAQAPASDSSVEADTPLETNVEAADPSTQEAVILNAPDALTDAPAVPTDDTRKDETPKGGTMAANAEGLEHRTYGAMDVVDLGDDESGKDDSAEDAVDESADETASDEGPDTRTYHELSHGNGNDDHIESVADDDVSDEVRPAKRPRARRYKIQEVIKVRQILLVQVVKEERGNKGAALTTYLSLAGRYCVLMPNTARGGGISRKITNAADRKKLKEIAGEISVPEGAGLIIRTAGAQRTKPEIRRDYEYLFRAWEQIRELTLKSIAPAPIYEEGNLIKRSIRDLYNKDIDEVLVEGELGYRTAKDFMKMIMPSHAKNVQLYREGMPLFARYQVESYLGSMFNPTVQLKSGGYIVIGVTEALVAIDVNSGKSTREGSIEDTALKTNLEAADEVARQLRLRDLAGLIVIDFIDMEERRNNASVEKRMKDALRTDRARIQVGRISGFGLMEMSRQRLRPGMLEATTQPCAHCHGTGLIRSDNSLALQILRSLEEEGTRNRSKEVLVKAPIEIVNYLFNTKREHIAQIEARYGMAIRLEADTSLITPDYTIEKFKTATRIVTVADSHVVSLDSNSVSDIDDKYPDDDDVTDDSADTVESDSGSDANGGKDDSRDDNGEGGKRKRRRRRRRGGRQNGEGRADDETESDESDSDESDNGESADSDEVKSTETTADAAPEIAADEPAKPVRKRRSRSRAKKPGEGDTVEGDGPNGSEGATTESVAVDAPAAEGDEAPAPKKRTRTRRKPKADEVDAVAEPETEASEAEPAVEAAVVAPVVDVAPVADPVPAAPATVVEPVLAEPARAAPTAEPEPAVDALVAAPDAAIPAEEPTEPEPTKPAKSRRAGWWSRG